MFDRLKRTLSDAVKNIGEKELDENDIDKIFTDLQISLLESDFKNLISDITRLGW